jgi:hypothetical protein
MIRVRATAVLLILFGPLGAVRAEGDSPASQSRRSLVPCRADSLELIAARSALAAIDARIDALTPTQPLDPLRADLRALLASRCLVMSAEARGVPGTKSHRAFRAWWQAGGRRWVDSYLSADFKGRMNRIVIPPEAPASLVPGDSDGVTADATVTRLMCPADAPACGAEARGFRRRAEMFFSSADSDRFTSPYNPPASNTRFCLKEAKTSNYATWRECLDVHRPTLPAVPLGDLRNLQGGWLVVHKYAPPASEQCVRTDFLHVDSGSVYEADSCRPTKSAKGTPFTPRGRRAGHVLEAALRETLWMLILSDLVTHRQIDGWVVEVPKNLTPAWPAGRDIAVSGFVPVGPTHKTNLHWSWQASTAILAKGSFDLGASFGGTYAAMLFDVLLAGFEAVPPKEPLPDALHRQSMSDIASTEL